MRVVVAMSGGVDSSVAAVMLQRQNHDVVGVTLRLYDCQEGQRERSCCGLAGVSDARAVSGALGIPHYVIDGQELFERRVLGAAWADYAAGRTPNPCVRCNEWMKFGLLYEQAQRLGASFVATGHHARVEHGDTTVLRRGRDRHKDQSYFLFSLTLAQLRMVLLPIGGMTKEEVRAVARSEGLASADRLESQDACIAQRRDLAEALRKRFDGEARPGAIIDEEGHVLGQHEGVHRFTIGQRKGLGVALGRPAYVTAIDAERGLVVVGERERLAAMGLRAAGVQWLADVEPGTSLTAEVQIRYRHRAVVGEVEPGSEATATVRFEEPQEAVTPGQAVVFYDGDRVIGGGWITSALDPATRRRGRGLR